MKHETGNCHEQRWFMRTRLLDSSKVFGLAIILSLLSLSCQGEDVTRSIPPITVDFYQIDTDAAWSPDGKSILFVKGDWPDSAWRGGIYLHDLATGRDSLISRNYLASSLTWSPDQKWIAYSQGAQIYTMKLNGDSLIRLTYSGRNFQCCWSPAGNRIAYHMTSGPYGTWVCNPDGNSKRRIANAESPSWFSDGFRLAGLGLGGEVYLLDTLGERYDRITLTNQYKTTVSVSPNGDKVVFVQRQNLWRVDTDGSNLKQLTTTGGDWPNWSPDSKWIVYTNGGDKNGHLWLMRPDGSEKHQITF